MMGNENLPLFNPEELPQTDEPKKPKSINVLQEMLTELMSARCVEAADIHKATGIPHPTLHDWYTGKVGAQKADVNLLKLAQYFSVSLEYLVYGIGSDEDPYERFNKDQAV